MTIDMATANPSATCRALNQPLKTCERLQVSDFPIGARPGVLRLHIRGSAPCNTVVALHFYCINNQFSKLFFSFFLSFLHHNTHARPVLPRPCFYCIFCVVCIACLFEFFQNISTMDAVLDLLHTLAQPEVQSAIAASAHSRGKQIGDTVSGNGIQISSNSAPTGGLETGRGTTAASGGQEMEEARNSSNREGNQDDSRVDGGEPFRFVSLAERRSASLGFSTDRHSSNGGRGHIRGDVTDVSGSRDLRTDRSRSCSRDRSPPHSRSPPRYRSAS